MNNFDTRLARAMNLNDYEDIDQAVDFLRFSGFNYEQIKARVNRVRQEAGMTQLNDAEYDNLMLQLDELP